MLCPITFESANRRTYDWFAAADIRREIVTGTTEWFEQTDNTLDAAVVEYADAVAIRMVTDKDGLNDSDNDSDYNSINAEREAQEDDSDEGKSHPKPKVPPPMSGLTSFEAISIQRVGWIAKKRSTETQDTTERSSQTSNGHPSLSGYNGRQPTRSGSNDARNYTTKTTGFWRQEKLKNSR
jgi:hypothetical protein